MSDSRGRNDSSNIFCVPRKKEEEEGGETKRGFELNYILISRPFRPRDMPNIRRNLHFKLDASCHHEASPRRLGCRRLAKTPPRCRFSKTCNAAASEKPAERPLEYSTYFFPSFRIYISISKQKIPDFPLLHFILAGT